MDSGQGRNRKAEIRIRKEKREQKIETRNGKAKRGRTEVRRYTEHGVRRARSGRLALGPDGGE